MKDLERDIALEFLNNLFNLRFEDEERKEVWRYSARGIELDKDLDSIERVIAIIEESKK